MQIPYIQDMKHDRETAASALMPLESERANLLCIVPILADGMTISFGIKRKEAMKNLYVGIARHEEEGQKQCF